MSKVTLSADVRAGAWSTVSVKLCDALGLTPLLAVNVIGYTPPEAPAGVPEIVAVPSPLLAKVTPEGSAPLSETDAVGKPVEVTVKEPEVPVVNVVLEPEVMAGAWSTVSVKFCEAFGLTPLFAVIVIG